MAYVHELSGSKLRSKLGSALNEAAVSDPLANNTDGFAAKQLAKMGWKAGRGLGKNLQGMATHIKVKKREDDVGIGHVKPELEQQSQWWSESMGNVFAKLNGGKKNATVAVKEYTDEELFTATGGARFGMRAQRKQTGKWARAESMSKEEEDEARSKVEWNGQGQAKIVLKVEKEKKKKRKFVDDVSEDLSKKKKGKRTKDVEMETMSKSSKKDKKETKASKKAKTKRSKGDE
ncbi:glycine rich nucleic binding domain [Fragilaria crotonensis]|nr:glycine rich nucleic binding domain [Fragilaria crotonensis]